MFSNKKFRAFDDAILDIHPELQQVLKPNDHYPELDRIMKNRFANLPAGSLNTKVIINGGKIVERIFMTPMGQVVSLFSKPSDSIFDQVA